MAKLSGKTAVSWVSQITTDYKLILLKTQSAEKYKISLHILTIKNNFSSLEDICQNTSADKWVTYYLFVYGSICYIWIYDSITPSSKGRANWTFVTVLKNCRNQVGWQKASPQPPPAPLAHSHKTCKWKRWFQAQDFWPLFQTSCLSISETAVIMVFISHCWSTQKKALLPWSCVEDAASHVDLKTEI